MSFEYFIGRRYLRTRQKQALITIITFLSMAGITVGVMTLIVVMGVMKGFENDLRKSILGGQSHILLKREDGTITGYQRLVQEIEKIDGVEAAAPFIEVKGLLRSKFFISPAQVKGIEPSRAGLVIKTLKDIFLQDEKAQINKGDLQAKLPTIVLARELANNLGARRGDIISLISPGESSSSSIRMPVMKQFQISGYFKSGYYEFDNSFAYIPLKDAQEALSLADAVTGIEVRVNNIYKANKIAEVINAKLGGPYRAQDWMQLNQAIFQAMQKERLAMFIILILTIVVAAVGIASTLIMLVMGKTRDIAILKAMGATDKSIRKIFVFSGMIIGLIGAGLGLGLGLLLCTILKHYDVTHLTGGVFYLMETIPVKLKVLDIISILSATLVICYLVTLYPARQAAKTNPMDSIRSS
jgi:lipoprotein-releasing system permease protein